MFIIEPFIVGFRDGLGFRYGLISFAVTLVFVLLGMIMMFCLIYKQVCCSMWVIKLVAMVGMLVVGLMTPRYFRFGGAWLFSIFFGSWLGAVTGSFLPDCLRAPERRKDAAMKKVKIFDYVYGLRLRAWVKSGELKHPQSRYVYRVVYSLDGEDLQFVEFVKVGCALRVVGGNGGNVMV